MEEVRFRLLRADDRPATNPEGDAFPFGLQDAKQTLPLGEARKRSAGGSASASSPIVTQCTQGSSWNCWVLGSSLRYARG